MVIYVVCLEALLRGASRHLDSSHLICIADRLAFYYMVSGFLLEGFSQKTKVMKYCLVLLYLFVDGYYYLNIIESSVSVILIRVILIRILN